MSEDKKTGGILDGSNKPKIAGGQPVDEHSANPDFLGDDFGLGPLRPQDFTGETKIRVVLKIDKSVDPETRKELMAEFERIFGKSDQPDPAPTSRETPRLHDARDTHSGPDLTSQLAPPPRRLNLADLPDLDRVLHALEAHRVPERAKAVICCMHSNIGFDGSFLFDHGYALDEKHLASILNRLTGRNDQVKLVSHTTEIRLADVLQMPAAVIDRDLGLFTRFLAVSLSSFGRFGRRSPNATSVATLIAAVAIAGLYALPEYQDVERVALLVARGYIPVGLVVNDPPTQLILVA